MRDFVIFDFDGEAQAPAIPPERQGTWVIEDCGPRGGYFFAFFPFTPDTRVPVFVPALENAASVNEETARTIAEMIEMVLPELRFRLRNLKAVA